VFYVYFILTYLAISKPQIYALVEEHTYVKGKKNVEEEEFKKGRRS